MTKKVIIQPLSANLERDLATFGDMDPFVYFEQGDKNRKTKTHEDGGTHPKWNDMVEFYIDSYDDELTVAVYDAGMTSDEVIGTCKIKFEKLAWEGGINEEFDLEHDGENAGKIHLKTYFKSDDEDPPGGKSEAKEESSGGGGGAQNITINIQQ